MGGFPVDCDFDLAEQSDFPRVLNDISLKLALREPQVFQVTNYKHLSYHKIIYFILVRVAAFHVLIKSVKFEIPQPVEDMIWDYAMITPVMKLTQSDVIRMYSSHLTTKRLFHIDTIFHQMRKMKHLFVCKNFRKTVIAGGKNYEILDPERGTPLSPTISSEFEGFSHFILPTLTIGQQIQIDHNGQKPLDWEDKANERGLLLFCATPSRVDQGAGYGDYQCYVSLWFNVWTTNFSITTSPALAYSTSMMMERRPKTTYPPVPTYQKFNETQWHLNTLNCMETQRRVMMDELAERMPRYCGVEISIRPGRGLTDDEKQFINQGSRWVEARAYTSDDDKFRCAAQCILPSCGTFHFSTFSSCNPDFTTRKRAQREYDRVNKHLCSSWSTEASIFIAALAYDKSGREFATLTEFIDAADNFFGAPTSGWARAQAFNHLETEHLFVLLTDNQTGQDLNVLRQMVPRAKQFMAKMRRNLIGYLPPVQSAQNIEPEDSTQMANENDSPNTPTQTINSGSSTDYDNTPNSSESTIMCYLGVDHPDRNTLLSTMNNNNNTSHKPTMTIPNTTRNEENCLITRFLMQQSNGLHSSVAKMVQPSDIFQNDYQDATKIQDDQKRVPSETDTAAPQLKRAGRSNNTSDEKTKTHTDTILSQTTKSVSSTIPSTTTNPQTISAISSNPVQTGAKVKTITKHVKPSIISPTSSLYKTAKNEQEVETTQSEVQEFDDFNIDFHETLRRVMTEPQTWTEKGSLKPLSQWEDESDHEQEEEEREDQRRRNHQLFALNKQKTQTPSHSESKNVISPEKITKQEASQTITTIIQTPVSSAPKMSETTARANKRNSSETAEEKARKRKRRRIEESTSKDEAMSAKDALIFDQDKA